MIKIFLAVLLLASSSFAQHQVQVKVDGIQYYCSQDPNNTGNSEESACKKTASRLSTEYIACKDAGFAATTCFNRANGKVPAPMVSCAEVADACNAACKDAGFASTSCFNTCFK